MTHDKDTILKKMNEDLNLKPKDNKTDELLNNITGKFVDILNEALEKKDAEIKYWKDKAYILFQYSNIGRLECPEHDTHIERTFDPWKVIIEEKQCLTCKTQGQRKEKSKK